MTLLSRIYRRKNQTTSSLVEMLDAKACPNCWGKQEYAGQERQYFGGYTHSIMHSPPKAFILKFVQKYVTGIQMKTASFVFLCKMEK